MSKMIRSGNSYRGRKFSAAVVLMLVAIMVLTLTVNVNAESYDYTDKGFICKFNGKEITSNFSADLLGRTVTNMQPGDDVTFEVEYRNDYSATTDWYMENEIVRTLEETAKAQNGNEQAEQGAYTYEVIHYDNSGNKEVLFNSVDKKIGGRDQFVDGREGLKQGTNALEDWFHIQTLEQGEHGRVVIKVAFEGETEVNDYMDTNGELRVRFAVELTPEGGNTPPGKTVKTGDYSNLMRWVAIALAASALLIILAIFSDRRDRRNAEQTGGDR